MNILILGYGKMGKTIESIAISRGHKIVERIDIHNQEAINNLHGEDVDVAIEFSQPDAAVRNIAVCLEKGIKVISGTTGWLERRNEIETMCHEKHGTFFYASNYSIGVNLFFHLNKQLAKLMAPYKQYKVEMTEIHHTEKKDSPSGTAITLAEGILQSNPGLSKWQEGDAKDSETLGIKSIREGKVPGTHVINYLSEIDKIEIKHEAFGREGFALGAVLVAEWIFDKNGLLSMHDFMGF